jgi:endonuclease-3 related protein
MNTTLGDRLLDVYHRLLRRYGPQHWWPADGAFEVILGAILTQSASWSNVERALANLKERDLLAPAALRETPQEELALLLRPSVYFNAKARKVKAFVNHLGEHYGDDLDAMLARDAPDLRQELLSIYGIGEETADDIVLYAANKPMFVIDAYTRRILGRLGVEPPQDRYSSYQAFFMESLPHDAGLFNEYHALLDHHAVETCRKRQPGCAGCCLLDVCPAGAGFVARE